MQVLDPLLSTTWLQQKGFPCELWAKDHPEIRSQSCPLVTVVLVEKHWIPVFCSPTADVLHIHTWDGSGAQHSQLNEFLHSLAKALGFREALICREQRIFYTTDLCGALSIAFLRSMLIGTQLPTTADEAAQIHGLLRQQFHAIIQKCQVTDRPWIWGAGDNGPVALTPATFDAISIDREARIDLINQKGTMMADDEIRFHIRQLVNHQPSRPGLLGSFIFLELLVFMCWDAIGHVIAETWCEQNPQIFLIANMLSLRLLLKTIGSHCGLSLMGMICRFIRSMTPRYRTRNLRGSWMLLQQGWVFVALLCIVSLSTSRMTPNVEHMPWPFWPMLSPGCPCPCPPRHMNSRPFIPT